MQHSTFIDFSEIFKTAFPIKTVTCYQIDKYNKTAILQHD